MMTSPVAVRIGSMEVIAQCRYFGLSEWMIYRGHPGE